MRALACVAVALAAIPSALATHPDQRIVQPASLDLDRTLERVVGVEQVTSDHRVWRASVRIQDRCKRRTRSYIVLTGYRRLESASAVQADGRGAKEVVAVLTDFPPRLGEARVVRLRSRTRRCGVLRLLFRYAAADAVPPEQGLELSRFTFAMHELADFPGRELVLTEYFTMPQMPSSVVRLTQYRYDRASDEYVAYLTQTQREP